MSETAALVTGAHGFIGRHLARALAAQGVVVIGAGHGQWTPEERRSWGLRAWSPGDVDLETLRAAGGTLDVVFHLAGGASVVRSLGDPLEDFRRTVVSTAAVLEHVRTAAPRARVILASSVSVYGPTDGHPAGEDAPAHPASPYAVHKLLAELLCAEHVRLFGIRSTAVRLPSVYGPGLRKQLLWDACTRLSRGERSFFGTGAEMRDWLHVDDAVGLLVLAARRTEPFEVVNGGGNSASVREIAGAIAEALGCAGPTFSGEARAGDPAHLVPDVARAASWGWRARIGWRDGVREYCEWFLRTAT